MSVLKQWNLTSTFGKGQCQEIQELTKKTTFKQNKINTYNHDQQMHRSDRQVSKKKYQQISKQVQHQSHKLAQIDQINYKIQKIIGDLNINFHKKSYANYNHHKCNFKNSAIFCNDKKIQENSKDNYNISKHIVSKNDDYFKLDRKEGKSIEHHRTDYTRKDQQLDNIKEKYKYKQRKIDEQNIENMGIVNYRIKRINDKIQQHEKKMSSRSTHKSINILQSLRNQQKNNEYQFISDKKRIQSQPKQSINKENQYWEIKDKKNIQTKNMNNQIQAKNLFKQPSQQTNIKNMVPKISSLTCQKSRKVALKLRKLQMQSTNPIQNINILQNTNVMQNTNVIQKLKIIDSKSKIINGESICKGFRKSQKNRSFKGENQTNNYENTQKKISLKIKTDINEQLEDCQNDKQIYNHTHQNQIENFKQLIKKQKQQKQKNKQVIKNYEQENFNQKKFNNGYKNIDIFEITLNRNKINQQNKNNNLEGIIRNTKKNKLNQNFIDVLVVQIDLDQQLRHAKHMFSGISQPFQEGTNDFNDSLKWNILHRKLNQSGYSMNIIEIKQIFMPTEQEIDPFLSVTHQHEEIVQKLIQMYIRTQKYWENYIQHQWTHWQIKQMEFTVENIDRDRKGFITMEDIANYINTKTDCQCRNRDVSLIYRRLLNNNKNLRLSFKMVMNILIQ